MAHPGKWLSGILLAAGLGLGASVTPALASDVAESAKAAKSMKAASAATPTPFMVMFSDEPLATYAASKAGLAALPRMTSASGRSRLNVQSAEARSYVSFLQSQQASYEGRMSAQLGRTVTARLRMQHAVNAIVTDMTMDEAARVAMLPGVKLIEEYREYTQDTDTGPTLIGSPSVWNGSYPNASGSQQGEGMVIGIIDSGINFGSPSFAAVDPVDGYVHVNPLGAGTYLGTCLPAGVDAGRCNAKLIGGYDFVCGAPGNQCVAANREEPGFGDTNGHGSHTASTAAGNRRNVVFSNAPLQISGVAPRANIIAYDACYTLISTGQGLCPNVSTVAAIDQAVADGIVDAINYSIGGGVEPWTELTSLAFKNAVAAGIYVATSAGNSGPAAGTLGHLEPWTASNAAAQHGRGAFATAFSVTGPGIVPGSLAPIYLTDGTGGIALAATIPGTTPLRISAGIDGTSDGCAAYPANTFAGAIAVIRRGTCSFTVKVNNASAAGAIAVIIANNQVGALSTSVPGTTVPTFAVTQTEGNAIRDFGLTNPSTATAQILYPPVARTNVPDALGSFSSRGPAGRFDLVKPDTTAPGVAILAAVSGTTISGSEQALALYDGTSMASPHHAGAAALIRQARPAWTVAEVKSALMMTATPTVLLEDQTTPANAFAAGSGRIRVDRAVNAALVLDETNANYTAANPATGGDPTALNLPSMARGSCFPSCTFTRTFRNTRAAAVQWQASSIGLFATVTPSSFTVAAGATQAVTVTINTTSLPRDGSWNFGTLELKEEVSPGVFNDVATLHLPIAVAVQPAVASLPTSASASGRTTGVTTFDMDLFNSGGSTLTYGITNSGFGTTNAYRALSTGVTTGFRSTIYSDTATAGANAQFAADNFTLTQTTRLTKITTEGFVVSAAALATAATQIVWSVFPDVAGMPAGDPHRTAASAVWTYAAAPTAPGVTAVGSVISLDLAAAGQTPSLPAGTYWLVVNTRGTFANRWAHYGSNTGDGSFRTLTVSTTNTGAWASSPAFAGLTMQVDGAVACGAPWFGPTFPSSGSVLALANQRMSTFINAGSLPAATYRGNICVSSNALAAPVSAVPVTLTVTP